MTTARQHDAILVTGYGNSGAGAVMDLLKECDGFLCPPVEFFVVQHPDGIMALENSLVTSWTEFSPDWAIRRFLELVAVLARRPSRLRFGQDYSRQFCQDFEPISQRYVERLIGFRYDGHLMFRRAEMNLVEHFRFYLDKRFGLRVGRPPEFSTFVAYPGDAFLSITREYFRELFGALDRSETAKQVALLVGASPYQASRSMSYFDSAKTIIVDRDPRDIFISAVNSTYLPRDVEAFIRWHKMTREASMRSSADPRVLRVGFEDLLFDYEATRLRILGFLGCDETTHARKQTHFVASESAKRAMKWRKHPKRYEIEKIERALPEYLYQGATGATGATGASGAR